MADINKNVEVLQEIVKKIIEHSGFKNELNNHLKNKYNQKDANGFIIIDQNVKSAIEALGLSFEN